MVFRPMMVSLVFAKLRMERTYHHNDIARNFYLLSVDPSERQSGSPSKSRFRPVFIGVVASPMQHYRVSENEGLVWDMLPCLERLPGVDETFEEIWWVLVGVLSSISFLCSYFHFRELGCCLRGEC